MPYRAKMIAMPAATPMGVVELDPRALHLEELEIGILAEEQRLSHARANARAERRYWKGLPTKDLGIRRR